MVGNSPNAILNNAESGKRFNVGVFADPKITKYSNNFYKMNGSYEGSPHKTIIQRGEKRYAGSLDTAPQEQFLADFIGEDITLDDKANEYKYEVLTEVKATPTDPVIHEGEHGSQLELSYMDRTARTQKFRSYMIFSKETTTADIRSAEVHADYQEQYKANIKRSMAQVLRALIINQATQINAGGGTYASMTAADTADVLDIIKYRNQLVISDLFNQSDMTLVYIPVGSMADFYENGYINTLVQENPNSRFHGMKEAESITQTLTIQGVKLVESKMAMMLPQGTKIPYLVTDHTNTTTATKLCYVLFDSNFANGIAPIINVHNPNHDLDTQKDFGTVFEKDIFNEFAAYGYQWGFGAQITDARLVAQYRYATDLTGYTPVKKVYYMDELLEGATATILANAIQANNEIRAGVTILKDGQPLDDAAFETQIQLVATPTDITDEAEKTKRTFYMGMTEFGLYHIEGIPSGAYELNFLRRVVDLAPGSKGTETYIPLATAVPITVNSPAV